MSRIFPVTAMLLCGASLALSANVVAAQPAADLVMLINQYRSVPNKCGNSRMKPATPLAPSEILERAQLPNSGTLVDGLRRIGYPAASGYIIQVSGTASPISAMKAIERAYCKPLLSAEYTEIGIRLEGKHWRIVLARRTR